jgi:hypothetical protein
MEGFQQAVAAAWFEQEQHQDPFIDLSNKLKATTRVLSRWSHRRVGNIKEQMLLADEVILRLDQATDAIDGWRIEARSAVRSVFDSLEQSGPVLPFFAELDFLFPSGALVGYGVPVLEWLAFRPCLVCPAVVVLF